VRLCRRGLKRQSSARSECAREVCVRSRRAEIQRAPPRAYVNKRCVMDPAVYARNPSANDERYGPAASRARMPASQPLRPAAVQ